LTPGDWLMNGTAGNRIKNSDESRAYQVGNLTEVSGMKRWMHYSFLNILVVGTVWTMLSGLAVASDVCSRGVAEPPFLAYGAKSNLLMLLDNSGSMLDMAYTDDNQLCFDEGFLSTKDYAGGYDGDSWYEWHGSDNVSSWADATSYAVDSLVIDNGVIYKASCSGADLSCTSSGTSLDKDEGVFWDTVTDTAWETATSYAAGDIVTYEGMLFKATSALTSSDTGLYDDLVSGSLPWTRLDEGYFEFSSTSEPCADAYSYSQALQIALVDGSTTVTDVTSQTPSGVTCFAATGNFLNWTMASKFDIQKKILTGGKYGAKSERLISESRGCAGTGFIKQVAVSNGTDNAQLTLRVRGAMGAGSMNAWIDDRVGESDNTARIEVLGVTTDGVDNEQCQAAAEALSDPDVNPVTVKQEIEDCIGGYTGEDGSYVDMSSTLILSLTNCKDIWRGISESVSALMTHCDNIYGDGTLPTDLLDATNPDYICSGIYDAALPFEDRIGYFGACWDTGGGTGGVDTCTQTVTCSVDETSPSSSDADYYYLCNGGLMRRCPIADFASANNKCAGAKVGVWPIALYDSVTSASCEPAESDPDSDGWVEEDTDPTCAQLAAAKYCGELRVPEVIDPSDKATSSEGTWNLPAVLIDAGAMGQLGVNRPLIVMKGYLEQATQPSGILHSTASELRIGAMAFNDNGALTECLSEDTTDVVQNYCPDSNKDGARVIAPIRFGTTEHIDDLVASINDVRATSWTPLAEAVYNGIGYYTQNTDLRLNDGDFQTDDDVTAGLQSEHYYAAGSYIMSGTGLYTTEVGGTSDDSALISEMDWAVVSSYRGAWSTGAVYLADDIVLHGGKFYYTAVGGTAVLKNEAVALGLSGPLYDAGVSWEFLIDPVINHCQGNYMLIITEGASTADINADVENFVLGNHTFNSVAIEDDGAGVVDVAATTQCGNESTGDGLLGSSYVDDLTYFALDTDDQFAVYPATNATIAESDYPFTQKTKNNITTYIVTAGVERDEGVGECNPSYLMDSSAANGGTTEAMSGEDPQELENSLIAVFNELRNRASAGSAASVISSARGGEGAIYQAIFWPELNKNGTKVAWAGDVHGLFLDENGHMFEDTDGNRQLERYEDLDSDGKLDAGEDVNFDGALGVDEDVDGDGQLDLTEDLDGDGNFDIDEDAVVNGGNGNGILDDGEDLDGDGRLDVDEDIDGDCNFDRFEEDVNGNNTIDGHDKRVIIYFDSADGVEKSRACWNTSVLSQREGCLQECSNATDLDEVHFLWSATQWLTDYPDMSTAPPVMDVLEYESNRAVADFNGAGDRERYIFTWSDTDGDGAVDDGEVVDFVARNDSGGRDWSAQATDFDVDSGADVDTIIRWMRGQDLLDDEDTDGNGSIDNGETDTNGNGQPDDALRSRQSYVKHPDSGVYYPTAWRLGDIIHSTPMTVASPAEGYHLIYDDFSFAEFLGQYKDRRHMVYFGANDGMLHAVNAGFYNDLDNKFYLGYNTTTKTYNDSGPVLGKEMWAYVPYNLHPHLKCLKDPEYVHKYFVDQRPRIFDVQIFPTDDGIHTNGWGTILVGGMRFGGSPILATDLTGADPTDKREFISSYFILDITNPEAPPVLLGELTQETGSGTVDLGYSSVIPTMVIMKDNNDTLSDDTDDINKWYLILGSGPHDVDRTSLDPMKGMSDQGSKISVLPLEWLVDGTALRIPDAGGGDTLSSGGYTFHPSGSQVRSFVSDLVTVDFDINPSYEEYKSDAVYFGTVEGEVDKFGNVGFSTSSDGTTYWSGGGHMYRLVMEPGGHIVGAIDGDPVTEPDDWEVNILLNLGSATNYGDATDTDGVVPHIANHPIQPITSAASVGTDGYNFWIYFGTGRFLAPEDKTDAQQQSYYGIKEPMEIVDDPPAAAFPLRKRKLNWNEVELYGSSVADPGSKGLALGVDRILVPQSDDAATAELECRNDLLQTGEPLSGDYTCMDTRLDNATDAKFNKLEKFIAGTGNCVNRNCTELATCSDTNYTDADHNNNCRDGWQKDFWPYKNREKNIGQATLLGGLVTFTTYQPNSGVCEAEGYSYLYGVYYKTGTSWYEDVFGLDDFNNTNYVKNKLTLGRGTAQTPNLHVGSGDQDGDGTKAFVQTSTGEIKEINQDNLPVKAYSTGRSKWKEYTP
jgi:hypothetical protein